jgi:pyruvate/2-oxoglutarate dehydrogenase complex dihydrolipoamide dehydrogenase (E3) component
LAQAFARLGSTVIQIERGSRLLKREDEEVSAAVQAALEADGVQVKTSHAAIRFESGDFGKVLVDIIGRNFRQPGEGLGWDDTPSSWMWRTIINPNRPL